jgi:2-dehydropantoate 2-reductase
MRIAVIGAGGTGGYFGGLLARAGEDVSFIARGATLAALRDRGLTVKSRVEGEFTLPVRATDDPRAVGPVDLVLFCVKAYDTMQAAEQIRPLLGPETMILSVQNGVENEERIAAVVGAEPVLGAVSGVSAHSDAPGVIALDQEPGWIRFGELGGGTSPRTERLLEVFQQTAFGAEVDPDIRIRMWEKFVVICALSGVTTLVRLPIGAILAHDETTELFRGVMAEVAAVGRARGVALPENCVDHWFEVCAGLNPGVYGSMYHDLVAGRRLEVGALNGAVVRFAQEHAIATPLNFTIAAALQPYASGAPAQPPNE